MCSHTGRMLWQEPPYTKTSRTGNSFILLKLQYNYTAAQQLRTIEVPSFHSAGTPSSAPTPILRGPRHLDTGLSIWQDHALPQNGPPYLFDSRTCYNVGTLELTSAVLLTL